MKGKKVMVLAQSLCRYVCLWQTRYVPFGNPIFARFAGNRYEWPCLFSFPSVLSRHIGAKIKAEAPNPAIRIGRKQIKNYGFLTVLLSMCFYPKRAAERHISSGPKGRISSGRKPTYRVPLRGTYRLKLIAGTNNQDSRLVRVGVQGVPSGTWNNITL